MGHRGKSPGGTRLGQLVLSLPSIPHWPRTTESPLCLSVPTRRDPLKASLSGSCPSVVPQLPQPFPTQNSQAALTPSTPCRRLTTFGWGSINTRAVTSSSIIVSVPSFSLNSFCFFFFFSLGESVSAVPDNHKLCSCVSHIWGNRRGQHIRSAMESLTLGKPPS